MPAGIGNKNGVALLMVLWVLVLLTVIVGEFCHAMRTRVNITRNFKESTEAYYIAVAGLNKAIEQMIRQEITPPKRVSVDPRTGESLAAAEETLVWQTSMDLPPMDFGGGTFMVRMRNESGRVNINQASDGMLKILLQGFDLDPSEKDVIVDSIQDWRDTDRNHRLNGAENDYYQSLVPPYACKDAPFDTPEELVFVRGVTREIYSRLKDRVTVFPKESTLAEKTLASRSRQKNKKKGFNFDQLNVNSLSAAMWAALPGMTEDLAADIMAFRAEQDFKALSEVQDIIGTEVFRGIARHLTLETIPYYTISAAGRVADSLTTDGVTAVVRLDRQHPENFQIIEWTDRAVLVDPPAREPAF